MAESTGTAPGRPERVREWFLLDGNRLAIAGVLVVVVFGLLWLVPVSLPGGSLPRGGLTRLFGALIGGNLTLITVVISINQLVLSRELRTPNELTREIDASVDYRDDVAFALEPRARPESPTVFLEHILVRLTEAVDRLAAATTDVDDPAIAAEGERVVRTLDAKVGQMRSLLDEREVDLFRALATILRYNLAAEYNGCRWLQRAHATDLDQETVGALTTVQQRIVDLEIGRHYVKTLYVQIELAKLSRLLLYVGSIALTTAVLAMVAIGADPTIQSVLVRIAIAITFTPFAVLLAYILRIATVAQRTAAFVPFGSTE